MCMFYRLVVGAQLIVLILLQFGLWAGEGSLPYVWDLQTQIEAQEQANEVLLSRNQQLTGEILALKEGKSAIEERARLDLGMIKEGETFYFIYE